jgi:hypothetical protein
VKFPKYKVYPNRFKRIYHARDQKLAIRGKVP